MDDPLAPLDLDRLAAFLDRTPVRFGARVRLAEALAQNGDSTSGTRRSLARST